MVSNAFIRNVGYVGAAANWLIPLAGIGALRNDPKNIDCKMSAVLSIYSFFFIRWALAITPANYPLCACHATNSSIQVSFSLGSKGRFTFGSFVLVCYCSRIEGGGEVLFQLRSTICA